MTVCLELRNVGLSFPHFEIPLFSIVNNWTLQQLCDWVQADHGIRSREAPCRRAWRNLAVLEKIYFIMNTVQTWGRSAIGNRFLKRGPQKSIYVKFSRYTYNFLQLRGQQFDIVLR